MSSIYRVTLTKAQLGMLLSDVSGVRIEDRFGNDLYNIECLSESATDDFSAWCDERGIDAELM